MDVGFYLRERIFAFEQDVCGADRAAKIDRIQGLGHRARRLGPELRTESCCRFVVEVVAEHRPKSGASRQRRQRVFYEFVDRLAGVVSTEIDRLQRFDPGVVSELGQQTPPALRSVRAAVDQHEVRHEVRPLGLI